MQTAANPASGMCLPRTPRTSSIAPTPRSHATVIAATKTTVALIAGANLNAYRFSIAWTRIVPDGAGAVNDAGVDYYKRLCDELLERNIAPYATLFHWDLPQALQEKGGWANRDTAYRLADYAAAVAGRLGGRIPNFIILNEAAVHTLVGHVLGVNAPGLKNGALIGPVTHHQNLGQGAFHQGDTKRASIGESRHDHGAHARAPGRTVVECAKPAAGLRVRCGVEQGVSRSAVQRIVSVRVREFREVRPERRRHGAHPATGRFSGRELLFARPTSNTTAAIPARSGRARRPKA